MAKRRNPVPSLPLCPNTAKQAAVINKTALPSEGTALSDPQARGGRGELVRRTLKPFVRDLALSVHKFQSTCCYSSSDAVVQSPRDKILQNPTQNALRRGPPTLTSRGVQLLEPGEGVMATHTQNHGEGQGPRAALLEELMRGKGLRTGPASPGANM